MPLAPHSCTRALLRPSRAVCWPIHTSSWHTPPRCRVKFHIDGCNPRFRFSSEPSNLFATYLMACSPSPPRQCRCSHIGFCPKLKRRGAKTASGWVPRACFLSWAFALPSQPSPSGSPESDKPHCSSGQCSVSHKGGRRRGQVRGIRETANNQCSMSSA